MFAMALGSGPAVAAQAAKTAQKIDDSGSTALAGTAGLTGQGRALTEFVLSRPGVLDTVLAGAGLSGLANVPEQPTLTPKLAGFWQDQGVKGGLFG
ncbi:MAG: hypothetical protein H7A33_05870 [Deltaproteobacteria bacterium]|nr:hypothetical protein [Deltaproteobacteria bacterium]